MFEFGKECESSTDNLSGNVEDWLTTVEQKMVKVLQETLQYAFLEQAHQPLEDWITREPAQIVLTLMQIYWCRKVVAALQSNKDKTKSLEALLVMNDATPN